MENSAVPDATATAPTPAAAPQACASGAGGGRFNRRTLYIGLALAAAGGMFLGWDWLVAVGLSTLIISLLPCAIMCAVGACVMCKGKHNQTGSAHSPVPSSPDVPVENTVAKSVPNTPAPADRTA